ncbi:DUF4391 domain-containing protein [Anaerocolumna sedimenticola]|jgi:hypothetical protein|uniref:DUF4391 domain-containing protein n=1 Tax=Anaerocolumna sedimenticola TaxID=2696063 RepID=A0A6P1TU43_9FIRM|nr:DUF4391 domain-containing protein [Anaerocolumna sedimenticola]QHQ63729.1 DUF4391 domain-containing protein [Anaerocolumna sedimenticola]
MFGLPKSTEINKPLPKKAVFDKFKLNANDRKLFDDQISRLAIVSEISPQTVSIAASEDVPAIYIILVTLKVADCDKKNIALLSKLIDQRMLFALQYEDSMRFAVYRAERVLMSDSKRLNDWELNLRGLGLGAVWENIIADFAGINLTGAKGLDESIIANERKEKLTKQIATLEKKAMDERQPRFKWELVQQIKKLKSELEGLQ